MTLSVFDGRLSLTIPIPPLTLVEFSTLLFMLTKARNGRWLVTAIETTTLSRNPSGYSLTFVYSAIGINTPSVTGGIGRKCTITAPQVCPP